MYSVLLPLLSLLSLASAQYLYPNCTQHCFEVGSNCCSPSDAFCRCAEPSLLADAPCCIIRECPLIDQLHALQFIEELCGDASLPVNFTAASCDGALIEPGTAVASITISTWISSSSSSVNPYCTNGTIPAAFYPTGTINQPPPESTAAASATVQPSISTGQPSIFTQPPLNSGAFPTTVIATTLPQPAGGSGNGSSGGLSQGLTIAIALVSTLVGLAISLAAALLGWRRRKNARGTEPSALPPAYVEADPPPYEKEDVGKKSGKVGKVGKEFREVVAYR